MAKPNRPAYADMIDLPDDPVETPPKAEPAPVVITGPSQDRGPAAVKDGTPTAYRPETRAKAKAVTSVPSRREAARLRREAPKPEPADYAQRSLYAREETFKLFRTLAFENDVAAQQLYREGLFLVLQKYGKADGLTLEDM